MENIYVRGKPASSLLSSKVVPPKAVYSFERKHTKNEGLWYKDDHARKLRKDTEKINHAKPIVACFSVNDYDTGRQGNFGENCAKSKPLSE